jgi:hypothetical protein
MKDFILVVICRLHEEGVGYVIRYLTVNQFFFSQLPQSRYYHAPQYAVQSCTGMSRHGLSIVTLYEDARKAPEHLHCRCVS